MEPTRLPTPADLHGPAIHSAQLKAFVELARAQPLPRLKVDAEAVRRGWEAERARRRRFGLVAIAAVLIGALGVTAASRAFDMHRESGSDQLARNHVSDSSSLPGSATAEPAAAEESSGGDSLHPSSATPLGDPKSTPPALAMGVRVEAVGQSHGVEAPAVAPSSDDNATADPGVHVVSTWQVEVAAGRYEIEVPVEAKSMLTVKVTKRHRLEVSPGSVVELSAGEGTPTVKVLAGKASLIAADGTRMDIVPQAASKRRPAKGIPIESAGELARKAEALMAAGDRKGAIGVLEQLVERYPRSSAARAGLIDLAKLLERGGFRDRARCAYQLYLERWPGTPVRGELERAIGTLGGARKCRALQPK